MHRAKEDDKQFDEEVINLAPSSNTRIHPALNPSPAVSQPQSQHRPVSQAEPQMPNSSSQPQTAMVQDSQGAPSGYQLPKPVVNAVKKETKPPCCGTLGVCISDLVIFIALGCFNVPLSIAGIFCSRGDISPGKLDFLLCYWLYRRVYAILILIAAGGLLLTGIIWMISYGFDEASTEVGVMGLDFGSFFVVIGVLLGSPAIAILYTSTCYSKDLRTRSQKLTLTMKSGLQAQIQKGPVIVAN